MRELSGKAVQAKEGSCRCTERRAYCGEQGNGLPLEELGVCLGGLKAGRGKVFAQNRVKSVARHRFTLIDGAETPSGAPGGTAVPRRCEVSLLQSRVALRGRLLQVARLRPRRPAPQWTLARTQAGDGRTRQALGRTSGTIHALQCKLLGSPRLRKGRRRVRSGRAGGLEGAVYKKRWRLSSPGFICCLSPGPGVSRESNGRG
ncbi:hypothetical protein LEMLEM_LOCUS1990 [Lemmus lemmus]